MYMNCTLHKKLKYIDYILSVFLVCIMFLLSACDPLTIALGGAAIAGTEAARNQNGVIGAISDSDLQARINAILLQKESDIFDIIELCVKHGVVVVIGYAKDEEQSLRAMYLVRKIVGTRAVVYDEITVSSPPNAKNFAIDSSITSRIKSALAFDANVQSLNYDVTTVKGVVYICGTAQSKYERDIVLNCARITSGVDKVVSYISINKNPPLCVERQKNNGVAEKSAS